MARKVGQGIKSVSKVVHVVWVKKAGMWCKTWFDEKGTQKQEWSVEKPTMEILYQL